MSFEFASERRTKLAKLSFYESRRIIRVGENRWQITVEPCETTQLYEVVNIKPEQVLRPSLEACARTVELRDGH